MPAEYGERRDHKFDLIHKDAKIIIDSAEQSRPNPADFDDIYDEQTIGNDLKAVDRLEERFKKDLELSPPARAAEMEAARNRSEAMEVIVADYGETNNWFGENAMCTRTSRYDDVLNGIDIVVEFENPAEEGQVEQRIALMIDATMSADARVVHEKIKGNVNKISQKKFAEVKYFESAVDGSKGSLKEIIPVVIGLEGENCDALIGLFAQIIKLKRNQDEASKKLVKEKLKESANHPCQKLFLEEIKLQLQTYLELAVDHDDKLKRNLRRMLVIVDEILEEKQEIDAGELAGDRVAAAIREGLEKVKPS